MAKHGATTKIKLSDANTRDSAIRLLSDYIVNLHMMNSIPHPISHFAIEGQNTSTLWSALLSYLDGSVVQWMKKDNRALVDKNFVINYQIIEFFENALEIDLNFGDIAYLENHPYWILFEIKKLAQMEETGQVDELIKENMIAGLTEFLGDVMQTIPQIDTQHFIVHEGFYVKAVDGGTVDITNDVATQKINANFFVYEQDGLLKVDSLDNPMIAPLNASAQAARSMHEHMIAAAKYRDIILKSLKDFVEKPNRDANQLYAKEAGRRPAIPDGDRPRVTIIGMGPAGLFTAIRDYQKGAKVVAVEKRHDYSRNNTFRLTPEIVNKLIGLFVDRPEDIPGLDPTHPLRVIIDSKSLTAKASSPLGDFYAITTKDFEYLANAWIEIMAKNDPNGMKIYRGYSYIPKSMDKKDKAVYIRETDHPEKSPALIPSDIEIPTDILVAADGYSSQCRTDCNIPVEVMSSTHPYATFTYHTDRADETRFFKSLVEGKRAPDPDFHINQLKALGWEKDSQPIARYFTTGEHPYLGIEVPQGLADEYNRLTKKADDNRRRKDMKALRDTLESRDLLLDEWGRATMRMFLPKADVDQMIIKRHALFPTQLQRAASPAIITPRGLQVFLVGDGLQSAHFQTGQGAIVAVAEAEFCSDCVEQTLEGKSPEMILDYYTKRTHQSTLNLHELAFHFPTGEHLQVTPTEDFVEFRADTRVEILEQDHRALKTESSREAQVKAEAKRRR